MDSFHQLFLLFAISFLLWSVHVDSSCTRPTQSMRQRYRQWMSEHNKIYTNSIEREDRYQIFKKNAEYVDAFNAGSNRTYTLGLNQFSDLTNEERIARFTGGRPPRHIPKASAATYRPRQAVDVSQLPKSWDWREKGAITPVKSQNCGTCWLYAGVECVESVNFIATGKLNILSEQEILDCDDLPGKGGCSGGWVQEVFEYVRHYGLTTEANYPSKPTNETCNVPNRGKERVARVSKFVNMPYFVSDEELMAAVVKQPVAIGIDFSNPGLGGYKSGVFTGPCTFVLNHSMQLVGYGETPEGLKYWIIRNSWSDGWGEGGYIRIQRGLGLKEGLCGINIWPAYPVY